MQSKVESLADCEALTDCDSFRSGFVHGPRRCQVSVMNFQMAYLAVVRLRYPASHSLSWGYSCRSEKHWVRCAEPASICRVGDKPTSRRQPTFSAHGHQGNFSHSSLVLAHRPSVLSRSPIELDVSPNLRRAECRGMHRKMRART